MKYILAKVALTSCLILVISCAERRLDEKVKLQAEEREHYNNELEETIQKMNGMLKSELISFDASYQNVRVIIKFSNMGKETINSFMGSLQFYNLLERTTCEVPIKSYDQLSPMQSRELEYNFSTKSDIQGCLDLGNSKMSNIKFRFPIDIILLSNGTRLDPSSIVDKIKY